MFDEDPDDQYERILCYHPESDCLFEVFSRSEFRQANTTEQVDDLSGVEWAEKRFIQERKNDHTAV